MLELKNCPGTATVKTRSETRSPKTNLKQKSSKTHPKSRNCKNCPSTPHCYTTSDQVKTYLKTVCTVSFQAALRTKTVINHQWFFYQL